MGYEDLKSDAREIKRLAIEKYVKLALEGNDNPGNTGDAHVADAERKFADVDQIFDDWIGLPDFSNATTEIDLALAKLATETYVKDPDSRKMVSGTNFNITQIEPTGAFAQGWESGTATNYAKFAGVFGPVISNQWLCGHVLRYAITAEAAIFDEARKSVASIAKAAKDTLMTLGDKTPQEFKTSLAVVAAVSGIVAVPLTAGGSLGAGYSLAAVGAAKEVAGLFEPKETTKHPKINAASPETVIQSVRTYLKDLNQQIIDKEDDIETALNRTVGELREHSTPAHGKASTVVLPRPTVADNPSFGDHTKVS